MPKYRILFEHQLARSEASKRGWQTRWDTMTGHVGPKGQEYLSRKYEMYEIEAPIVEYDDEDETR